ncbi:thioredoxin-dependent thiol peroxidase [Jiella sp. MQZ9-1]|uniref:thioredoxin-dependent peroxiredoxin n=1 Tax=Jiella flava TaxID=2816857 RepID=A0A939JWA3_9HYPH|nr:thioredoxin-dependent thiol peroxidase [Jiella flava]MBO0662842.1 thioredoxin-dependent thiol peroxidase [Jiella flava]MCD2471397.1 thioredoxin-dependent thiol peroxidase [Jiella flava]
MTISEGETCPNFSLPDERGEMVALTDIKGRPFVLYFYPKDDTSGCTREAVDFTGLKRDFDAVGVTVFGVSPDPVKKHQKFIEKHDLAVRLLADEEKSLLSAFGIWVEKSMYGRKYMGVERTTALIDADGKIVRIWEKVKVPGHAEEVLEAAKQLAAS